MPRRRPFGTARKLRSGRWQARWWDEAHGCQVTAPGTFDTKAAAGAWLASVQTDQARGRFIGPALAQMRFGDYAEAWLDGKVNISPRSREIYEAQLRNDILPTFGGLPLAAINPELIRSWYANLARTRSRSVAAKAYVRLRQIFSQAVEDERVLRNPCRIAKGGVEPPAEERFATIEELYALAAAITPRHRALVLTGGLSGLRQGELFALRWADVDLADALIHVRRKRLRLASGEVIEDDPKSRAGKRVVALPAVLVEELVAHRRAFSTARQDAYVFTSSSGLPLDRTNFRQREWRLATGAVGLEGFRFHDLRHTAGTLAAQTGASTKELMARLGHSSARAALMYQHASEARERGIATGLDLLVRQVPGATEADGTTIGRSEHAGEVPIEGARAS